MTSINRPLEDAIKLARAANAKLAPVMAGDGELLMILTGDRLPTMRNLVERFEAEWLKDRGYATRKLGRTDEGIGYYQRSIALDPHYAKVREYLGEAWIVKGRPDLAKAELATIKTLCGTQCEEYRDLKAAIDGHPES